MIFLICRMSNNRFQHATNSNYKITVMKITALFFGIVLCFELGYSQNPDVLKSDALMSQSIDDYASAAQLFESAVAAYKTEGKFDTTSVYLAGVNYNKIKEYSKALLFFDNLNEKGVISSDLYFSMSDSYIGLKDYKRAKEILEKNLKLFSEETPSIFRRLATVCFNGKEFQNSIAYANKSLEESPNDTYILFIKMIAYAQQGKIQEAIVTGEELLKADPNDQRGIEHMGLFLSRQTDLQYDNEKRRYENISNPNRVDYTNTRKKLAEISKQYNKAIPYLEKALTNNPNNTTIKRALDTAKRRMNEE